MFDATSRYASIDTIIVETADGRRVACKKRRILPHPIRATAAREVMVMPGDRLDTIAARTLGDPLLYWRLADATSAMNPDDLEHPGTVIVVPGAPRNPR